MCSTQDSKRKIFITLAAERKSTALLAGACREIMQFIDALIERVGQEDIETVALKFRKKSFPGWR